MRFIFILASLLVSFATANATPPKVIVSIQPIACLVAGVMKGVGRPDRLIPPSQSPHTYQLRPTDIEKLNHADLVFWIDPSLETVFPRALQSLPPRVKVIPLLEESTLTRYTIRSSCGCAHAHVPEKRKDLEKKHESHSHTQHIPYKHEHRHTHKHNSSSHWDPHIWLDPDNAKTIVEVVARHLIEIDPAHKDIYQTNKKRLFSRLNQLKQTLNSKLEAVQNKAFLVFHDGYQYFEKAFHLSSSEAITPHTDLQPGLKYLISLEQRARAKNICCIFSEAQFTSPLPEILAQHIKRPLLRLDPLGVTQDSIKEESYFKLLQDLANTFYKGLLSNDLS